MDFVADLFIIAKTWKQPRRPSVGGWINKLRYIQIMECYSMPKRNELSSHEKTWKKFKCISLTERSQSEVAVILYSSNCKALWKRQNNKH